MARKAMNSGLINFFILSNAVRTQEFLLIPGFVKKQHALFKEQQQK